MSTPEAHPLVAPHGASSPSAAAVVSSVWGRRDYVTRRALLAGDVVGLVLAYVLALVVLSPLARPIVDLGAALLTIPVWVVIFKAYGLYDRDGRRVSHTTVDDLPWIFHGLLVGTLLTWVYFRLLPEHQLVFGEVAVFVVVAVIAITIARWLVRSHLLPRLLDPERVLFVGRSPMRRVLVRKIAAHPEYQLKPIGEVRDPDQPSADFELPDEEPALRTLGNIEDLPEIVSRTGAERILITQDDPNVSDLLRQCRLLQLKVSILPKPFEAMGSGVEVDDLEGVTVLGVNPMVLSRSSRVLKRALDLAVAVPALIVTAPLALGIAVAIKLDSKGPVLFRQRRVGRRGREFRVCKFRTMQVDAESHREELMAQSRDPDWLLLDHDPRISRVGRFLRRTSLDELPQLLNVVRGEMSMVGPRPLMEDDDRRVLGWARSRLDLTPGLTGLWQVLGRTSIPFEEMVKLDYLYVSNWSLWEDVRLILRTFSVVLSRRGAN